MWLAATTKQAGRCATILQLTTNPITHDGTEQAALPQQPNSPDATNILRLAQSLYNTTAEHK